MDDKALANILGAFISRMTLNDMEQIKRASDASWWAQMNGGSALQVEAQRQERAVINAVIARMLPTDKETISVIIKDRT